MDKPFPTKRMTAGGVIRNRVGELLIVKPSYRPGWLLPGGICERDEAPSATLTREVREELNIGIRIAGLSCVDYLSAHDQYEESIHFLFSCEAVSTADIEQIRLPPDELLEFRFYPLTTAYELLVPTISRRLQRMQQEGADGVLYLENGETIHAQ